MPTMAGLFGGGGGGPMYGTGGPNPYAGMNPYGGGAAGAGMLGNATGGAGIPGLASAGMGMLGGAGPTGLPPGFNPNGMKPPQQIPPQIQAMLAQMQAFNANPAAMQNMSGPMAGAPGMTPWGQGPQSQMSQAMPAGNWGGILSGMMGPRLPPGQAMQVPQARQPVPRQAARAPRRATYGGGSAGNISLSGS